MACSGAFDLKSRDCSRITFPSFSSLSSMSAFKAEPSALVEGTKKTKRVSLCKADSAAVLTLSILLHDLHQKV